MGKPLRLRAFGGLSLDTADASTDLGAAAKQPRRLALLVLLAVSGSRGMRRDKVLALLWPEVDEAKGRQALSQAIYALRKDTGEQELILGSDTLKLNREIVSSDIADFEAAIAGGDAERAAEIYAPFLDGVNVDDSAAFERWSDDQRLRYATVAEQVIEKLAVDAGARGDHVAAAKWWRRLTSLDPLKTRGAIGLMNALAASGYRADALRHAETYTKAVREELDADPSSEVVLLAERLREFRTAPRPASVRPSTGTDAAAAGATPTLGAEGRFEIEREIGRGGMAIVFLAHDRRHDRRVALKMLHPELASAVGRDRLQREIMVTARLQHPHILPLHDSGESDGTLFYVMPFVEGESLRARLSREERLPIDTALALARDVADALDHAHRHGVIHRDIKPENILLGEGHAFVADFGVARTIREAIGDTLTQTGTALGTPAYMSPEQLAGDKDTDARSDIYSLGCVLYEMIAGRPPWIGTDARAMMVRRFTEPAPRLQTLLPDCPTEVDDLIARMLDPEPNKRFENGAEVVREIAALLSAARSPVSQAARLPVFANPVIGRADELTSARALLTTHGVRWLTMTGAGGSGKTRLAIQLATDVARSFRNGVFFVDLSAVSESDRVLPTIARALGLKDRGSDAVLDTLVDFFGDGRALLVLDNLEQVTTVASSLARLLQRCAGLSLLVTSRVLLRARGEHEFYVAPFRVPGVTASAADLRESPAVQLFIDRAQEARPGLTFDDDMVRTIADVCASVDGLPLAIELAAARSKLLSPVGIQSRLGRRLDLLAGGPSDQPTRHHTLRTAIAWSYDLLDAEARRAFRLMSVFSGGCDLDAIGAVIGGDDLEVLDLVDVLVGSSLIRRFDDDESDGRYTMLETIREFASEQLRQSVDGEERAARNAHRDYYRKLAETLTPELTREGQSTALARLNREWENLRSALEWTEHSLQPAMLAEMTLSLWRYWLVRGVWKEGREWLGRALRDDGVAAPVRAELLGAAGAMAQNQGDYLTSRDSFASALAIWRAAGNTAGVARTLASMGWLAWRECRFTDARLLSEESLELNRGLADDAGIAQALNNLGWVAIFEGRYDHAETLLSECLGIRRRLEDRRNIAFALTALAWASALLGKAVIAHAMLDECIAIFREIGEQQLYAFAQRVRAEMLLSAGDITGALALVQRESIPIFRAIGDRWGLQFALGVQADALLELGQLSEAEKVFSETDDILRTLSSPYCTALAHLRLGVMAMRRGNSDSAAENLRIADQVLTDINGAMHPYHRTLYDRIQRLTPATIKA